MKTSTRYTLQILSLIIVCNITQLCFNSLSAVAVSFLARIHNSALNLPIYLLCFTVSYAILGVLVFVYLVHSVILHPNLPEFLTGVSYFCASICYNSVLKLILGEIRPYMLSLLNPKFAIIPYDCEVDFGMPSGHINFAVTVYFLFRLSFFDPGAEKSPCEREASSISEDSRQSTALQGRTFVSRRFTIKHSDFSRYFCGYIILLGICRILAASHFFSQVVFSFFFAYLFGSIYARHFRTGVRDFFREILRRPRQNPAVLRRANLVFAGVIALMLGFWYMRKARSNSLIKAAIVNYLASSCPNVPPLENKNAKDSLFILIPVFLVNFAYFFSRPEDFPSDLPRFTSGDSFSNKQLLRRGAAFLAAIGPAGLAKLCTDKLLRLFGSLLSVTERQGIVYLFMSAAAGYGLAVLLPRLFQKFGVLIEGDYPSDPADRPAELQTNLESFSTDITLPSQLLKQTG